MPEEKSADDILESSLDKIELLLKAGYGISGRAVGMLLLQRDEEVLSLVKQNDAENFPEILDVIKFAEAHLNDPLSYVIAIKNQAKANRIIEKAMKYAPAGDIQFREKLSRIMIDPFTGTPILLLVLYYGIYKFVGSFGAGVLVDFIENNIFVKYVNPRVLQLSIQIIPWKVLRDLFTGEYGIITLGVRYAVALIFPIVTTFFVAFAVIEDSGYLPRLALLIDKLFKKIGLTGRAVIPIVLGLGCDTMATMVTRTLPTKRERVIATILLALAVPCSAQLGVILSLLEGNPAGLWVWVGVISLVFIFVGFVSSKALPGEGPSFYMEVPPLRIPKPANVFMKTWTRVKWYFIEILPVFILVSFFIWVGQLTGIFDFLTAVLTYPVRWIGLPDKTAVAFLFGFFRRDYGAGGLYDIKRAGLFTGNQLVVACITLTLFLPCIAQFLMNIKERGWKTAFGISAFVLFFSFFVGFVVNLVFNVFGIRL